ncbi:hypothetical protein Trydic_g9450 [Trypoxylus dichotomus]
MRLYLSLLLVLLLSYTGFANNNYQDFTDNEFAEFEEFEAEDELTVEEVQQSKESSSKDVPIDREDVFISDDDDEADIMIEDDSEFEHFQDTEEFEGFADTKDEKLDIEPKITITTVPIHFRANWDSYWLEILMITGLVVYFVNFATGKNKNTKIANAWFQTHRTLLEDNFSLVGDDGISENLDNVTIVKESENIFTLWCSGRTCCEGMLVELKLIKRQDLVAVIAGMMRPTLDQVHIKVMMNRDDMDTFVFCVASKKTAVHLAKDMADISVYCPEKKAGEKYNVPSSFNVMSEIAESTSAMLDSKVTAVLNKYTDLVDYIHFSDQYSGAKQPEDSTALKLPDTQKVLLFGFNMPVKGMPLNEAMEQLKPLLIMVFYCIEKVKRYRLSKEGKNKADKNRQRVEEVFLKSTHAARAEAAAARREEKRRQEKEKVMAEDDPEKQRRWEEKEQKRQAKKRAPKMKQLKVKAL